MLKPREWQREALEIWGLNRRGVVSVVTGGGKTQFALLCFTSLLKEDSSWQIAVVVPTLALLDQWVVTLNCDLGIPMDEISLFSGEASSDSPSRANVFVINTARKKLSRLTGGGKWFLVVDECHRAGSVENAQALQGHFDATLGLSATPERQYDDGFQRYVLPALGPIIYEYTYADARRDGVISSFEIRNVRFPLIEEERIKYDMYTARLGKLTDQMRANPSRILAEQIERLLIRRASVSINARWRVPSAVATSLQTPGKSIIFHERIQAAEELAQSLNNRDRRATVYHSRVYGPIRRERLRLFRTGAYDTLVTCRSLDEGLNVPDASVAIIAASTASHRQRIQRLGRVLRASGRAKHAIVVTLYATDAEERLLREEEARLKDVANTLWFETLIDE